MRLLSLDDEALSQSGRVASFAFTGRRSTVPIGSSRNVCFHWTTKHCPNRVESQRLLSVDDEALPQSGRVASFAFSGRRITAPIGSSRIVCFQWTTKHCPNRVESQRLLSLNDEALPQSGQVASFAFSGRRSTAPIGSSRNVCFHWTTKHCPNRVESQRLLSLDDEALPQSGRVASFAFSGRRSTAPIGSSRNVCFQWTTKHCPNRVESQRLLSVDDEALPQSGRVASFAFTGRRSTAPIGSSRIVCFHWTTKHCPNRVESQRLLSLDDEALPQSGRVASFAFTGRRSTAPIGSSRNVCFQWTTKHCPNRVESHRLLSLDDEARSTAPIGSSGIVCFHWTTKHCPNRVEWHRLLSLDDEALPQSGRVASFAFTGRRSTKHCPNRVEWHRLLSLDDEALPQSGRVASFAFTGRRSTAPIGSSGIVCFQWTTKHCPNRVESQRLLSVDDEALPQSGRVASFAFTGRRSTKHCPNRVEWHRLLSLDDEALPQSGRVASFAFTSPIGSTHAIICFMTR